MFISFKGLSFISFQRVVSSLSEVFFVSVPVRMLLSPCHSDFSHLYSAVKKAACQKIAHSS